MNLWKRDGKGTKEKKIAAYYSGQDTIYDLNHEGLVEIINGAKGHHFLGNKTKDKMDTQPYVITFRFQNR